MSKFLQNDMLALGQYLQSIQAIKVPEFQRNYAWTDEEVSQLFEDILEAFANNEEQYFLGPMVLKQDNKELVVIDGQQRITTFYIFLSVIRRLLRQNGEERKANWINARYFGEEDYDTGQMQPKLRLNEINDPFFRTYVAWDVSDTQVDAALKKADRRDSNYLLLQAIKTTWDKINKEIARHPSWKEQDQYLSRIRTYLDEKVFVLLLTVADEADAYFIFETLNDRGIGLATMDLLKNHIFSRAKPRLDEVKASWTVIRESLLGIDSPERFIQHYWASRVGRVPRGKLYSKMRSDVTDSMSAVTLAENLADASRLYAALNIPDHPYWNDFDEQTRQSLDALQLLGDQKAIPILLASAQVFPPDEFSKLVRYLVVMSVRYNLIGERPTGISANYYIDIPPRIRSKDGEERIRSAMGVARRLKQIYPSDEEFKEAFRTRSLKDTKRVRYILSELEKTQSGKQLVVSGDTQQVNIEHVFPKNPSEEWNALAKEIGEDNIEDYIYRLGNQALVQKLANKKGGAKSFDAKRGPLFQNSLFTLTRMISSFAVWNIAAIEQRQSEMAALAVSTWRIDFS